MHKFLNSLVLVICIIATWTAFAADSAYAPTRLCLPPVQVAPIIDGAIGKEEWLMTSPTYGSYSSVNGDMTLREVHHHIGYDDDNLYILQESELPRPPMELSDDDAIAVTFGSDTPKTITFTKKSGFQAPGVQSATQCVDGYLVFEAAIPWSTLGIDVLEYGREHMLQVSRIFKNLDESALWSAGDSGVLIPMKDIPVVGFKTLGKRWKGTGYEIQWSVANPGPAKASASVNALLVSTDAPQTTNIVLSPGKGKESTALMRGILQPMNRRLEATITNEGDGTILYSRVFSWEAGRGIAFVDPDPPYVLDMAVYPSRSLIRGKLSCANADKMAKAQSIEFKIVAADGTVFSSRPHDGNGKALLDEWELPKLPEGTYDLVAVVKTDDGTVLEEKRDFSIASFPWQGLNLGAERVVFPPYVPLKYSDRTVTALQTGYHVGAALWDQIIAQGENILAAPVALNVNGVNAKMTGTPKVLETADDRVVLESVLDCGPLELTLRQEYEFDGFCKVTMDIKPVDGAAEVSSMTMDFPLKNDIVQDLLAMGNGMRKNTHLELSRNDGIVWQSNENRPRGTWFSSFRPYIWLGELWKGLAFVCETQANWEVQKGTAAQEIIRDGDKATLRLNIINKQCALDAPRQIVMAFQATPTRPLPPNQRKLFGTINNCWNPKEAICFEFCLLNYAKFMCARVDDGVAHVPNDDWSFVEYMRKADWETEAEVREFAREYLKKNGLSDANFSVWKKGDPEPGDDIETRMYQGARFWKYTDYRIAYLNPKATCPSWPEWNMYIDEWYQGEWRPSKTIRDEYCGIPDENYCDFLLWNALRLHEHGWYGYYLDNLYDALTLDPVINPYGRDTGYFWNFFQVRELVRRTTVLAYKMGYMLDGRPFTMIHQTDCNVVPWLSLAGYSVDGEMNYGDSPYPTRFSPAYVRTNMLGTQTGNNTILLTNTLGAKGKSATESLIAFAYAYGLLNQYDQCFTRIDRYFFLQKLVWGFGYGQPDVDVWVTWMPDCPVKCLTDNAGATFVRKQDGNALLLVGNLSSEDTTCEFTLPENYSAVNAETDEALTVNGENHLLVPMKGYYGIAIKLTPVK